MQIEIRYLILPLSFDSNNRILLSQKIIHSMNIYKLLTSFSFILFILLAGCNTDITTPVQPTEKTNNEIYQSAVIDAMIAEETEICSTLIAIRSDNNYLKWQNGNVLVVTWTKHGSSYPVGDTVSTWWGETWVTAVPEIKDWYKKNPVPKENLTLRTEQLLGMPPNTGYLYFVEMWVNPADLQRPAYDYEIDDNVCGLSFTSSASADFISWFNNNILSSYFPPPEEVQYPWTRLGYTYDWGNKKNEIGLSEFIIKKNAKVIVNSKSLTAEYLQ